MLLQNCFMQLVTGCFFFCEGKVYFSYLIEHFRCLTLCLFYPIDSWSFLSETHFWDILEIFRLDIFFFACPLAPFFSFCSSDGPSTGLAPSLKILRKHHSTFLAFLCISQAPLGRSL